MPLNSLPASSFCLFPSILPEAARVCYSGSDLPNSRSPMVLLESRCFIIGFCPSSQQAVPPLSCRASLSHSKDYCHSLQMEGWLSLPCHWLVWTASRLSWVSVSFGSPSIYPILLFCTQQSVHSVLSLAYSIYTCIKTLSTEHSPSLFPVLLPYHFIDTY